MVGFENKGFKGMAYRSLQMTDNCLPVFTKVIVDVIIIRLPHKHVRSQSRLRKTEFLGINFHVMGAVGYASFKNQRIRFLGDFVVLHELGEGAFLVLLAFDRVRKSNLAKLARVALDKSLNNRATSDAVNTRNVVDNNFAINKGKGEIHFLLRRLDVVNSLGGAAVRERNSAGDVLLHLLPRSTYDIFKYYKLGLFLEEKFDRTEKRLTGATFLFNIDTLRRTKH
mmetsp:Transcript_1381/g.3234  ORF Transcript_1381/g.3234 Transcript_1381/m.3234 type:complete len:225 (+) Transcript_1381:615-1289(+)